MKNPLNNTTRRSFIKKSTAAALAAVNVTVFSGLINAAEGGGGTGTGTGGTTGWFTTGSTGSGTTGWVTTGGGACTIITLKGCVLSSPGGGRPDGYWCPCVKNGTTKMWGAICDDASGKNPKSQC